MELLKLNIENFGIFSGRSIQFDSGFQLIYGPNEAGKSTLLELIRNVMFGIPEKTPYDFGSRNGEVAATATIQLSSGETAQFRRRKGRKGRKDVVVGEFLRSSVSVDEAALSRLLGHASPELFHNVFGFSLAELAKGRDSLKDANFTEAFYGGGIGGLTNFEEAKKSIEEQHLSLYKSSGRATKPRINQLIKQLSEKRREIQRNTYKPSEYVEQRKHCDDLQLQAEKMRKTLDQLYNEQRRLKRLQSALVAWRKLADAREELDELVVPESFPSGTADRFHTVCERLEEIDEELTALHESIGENQTELNLLLLAPELIAVEPDIQRLTRDLGKIEDCERDLPKRKEEIDNITTVVQATLKMLSPDWTLDTLEQFRLGVEQRQRVEEMHSEWNKLENRQTQIDSQRPGVIEELETVEVQLIELGEVNAVPELEELIERSAEYRSDCDSRKQIVKDRDELNDRIHQLIQHLWAPLQTTLEDPADLPIPLRQSVREFQTRFEQVDDEIKTIETEQKRLQNDLQETVDKLSDLDALASVPNREQLEQARHTRNAGWNLIRRNYIEGEAVDEAVSDWLGIHQSLPDRFEQLIAEADHIADDRQEKAEQVAQRDSLAIAQRRCRERLEQLGDESTKVQSRRDAALTEWNQLWAGCEFLPLSPPAMLEWLTDYDRLQEHLEQRTKLDRQEHKLNEQIKQFEQDLCRALPDSTGNVGTLLKEAQRRVKQAADAATLLADCKRQRPKWKRKLVSLDTQQEELNDARADWDSNWNSLLNEYHLPEEWNIYSATTILSGLDKARHKYKEVESLEARVHEMTEELEEFEGNVSALVKQVASDLAHHPAVAAVTELQLRLERAKKNQNQHDKHALQIARDQKSVERLKERLRKFSDEQEDLLSKAGATDAEAFRRVAEQAKQRDELQQLIRDCRNTINGARDDEDAEAFQSQLETASADAIATRLDQLTREIEQAENDQSDAFSQVGVARNELEKLAGESRTAQLELQRQGLLAELLVQIDQWAPLVLAHTLMTRAMEKFEREHQPDLQRDAAELLQTMTGGRYVELRTKLDEDKTMILVQHDGVEKTPAELSTGTRQQLYLAIRLAYVREYCRRSEPLPVVMDDVLVNFDKERAHRTLKVLSELAESVQVLFLTCHESMVQMIGEVLPRVTPIELQSTAFTTEESPKPLAK